MHTALLGSDRGGVGCSPAVDLPGGQFLHDPKLSLLSWLKGESQATELLPLTLDLGVALSSKSTSYSERRAG